MEELKDQIIRLALYYADVLLGLDRAYYNDLTKSLAGKEESLELAKEVYELACQKNLDALVERAGAIAAKYCDDRDEDDLK